MAENNFMLILKANNKYSLKLAALEKGSIPVLKDTNTCL